MWSWFLTNQVALISMWILRSLPSLAGCAITLAGHATSGSQSLCLTPRLGCGVGPAAKSPVKRVGVLKSKQKADLRRAEVRIRQVVLCQPHPSGVENVQPGC